MTLKASRGFPRLPICLGGFGFTRGLYSDFLAGAPGGYTGEDVERFPVLGNVLLKDGIDFAENDINL